MAIYLKNGDTGEKVKALQTALNALGHNCGTADGIWGAKTEAAVRAFQTAQNLGIDEDGYNLALGLSAPKVPGTDHFKFEEFACPDGTAIPTEYYGNLQKLMNQLEILRHSLGDVPLIIRSGYRSPAYNKQVGGAGGSQHLTASAADVYCQNKTPNCYTVGELAYKQFYGGNIGGVGLGSNVNVHVDVRGTKALWWYTYASWDAWKAHQ